MKLRISDSLVLAADFVTSTQAILAKRRVGKTYTAQVQAEELLEADQQVVAIDPTGAWYGLRSSTDGRGRGYQIAILGGKHGDAPLDLDSGTRWAEAVATDRFSAIFDLSEFDDVDWSRFIADFLSALYRHNTSAMHLFIDEADVACPQTASDKAQHRALRAANNIVRRGGIKGIGCTLISQRAALVNKNVLSQVDQLIALQMNSTQDIKQIRSWVSVHDLEDDADEMIASLPSLPRGTAWVWSPAAGIFKRIKVRAKRTFDSGRTPEPGEASVAPKVLAPVDVRRLGQSIASAVERAAANDPTLLKKQVADLRRDLEKARSGKGADAEVVRLRAEVEALRSRPATTALKTADVARLEKQIARFISALERQDAAVSRHHQAYATALEGYTKTAKAVTSAATVAVDALRATIASSLSPLPARAREGTMKNEYDFSGGARGKFHRPNAAKILPREQRSPSSAPVNDASASTEEAPKPAHLKILSSIAWWESIGVAIPDLVGVAFMADTSSTSSSFENNRAWLRARGYIEYPQPGKARLTELGRATAPSSAAPATRDALQDTILGAIPPGMARLLRVLIDRYPSEMKLDDLAEAAGTSIKSSSFENNRAWLRSRGLSEYPRAGYMRATRLLFPEELS